MRLSRTAQHHTEAGLSFVICTHNGAAKLGPTLDHLRAQRFDDHTPREVVLVDNASTDDTCDVARAHLAHDPRMPLRIVHEPRRGTGFARRRGLREASYDFVTFVDDDNWLVPEYGRLALERIAANPSIGLVCGRSEPVFAAPKPAWFDALARSFAVGAEFPRAGDVTGADAHWWTAGLTIRKAAWEDLLRHGFEPRVHGRDGRSLGAGEDTEMCLAILLAGWRAHYDPRLLFRHWMPAERLTWRYVCRLSYEGQAPAPVLLAYRRVLSERARPAANHDGPARWTTTLARTIARSGRRAPPLARRIISGEAPLELAGLAALTLLGTLSASLALNARYDALVDELRAARWLGGGPERVASQSRAPA